MYQETAWCVMFATVMRQVTVVGFRLIPLKPEISPLTPTATNDDFKPLQHNSCTTQLDYFLVMTHEHAHGCSTFRLVLLASSCISSTSAGWTASTHYQFAIMDWPMSVYPASFLVEPQQTLIRIKLVRLMNGWRDTRSGFRSTATLVSTLGTWRSSVVVERHTCQGRIM